MDVATREFYKNKINAQTGVGRPGEAIMDAISRAMSDPTEFLVLYTDLDADGKRFGSGFYGIAGATVVFGQVVYKSSTDSRWELARGNAEGTVKPEVAIVITGGADGETILLSQDVHIREDDWAWSTVGAPLFIHPDTAGLMDESAPTTGEYAKVVAHVLSADSIHFRPDNVWVKVG